MPLLEAWQQKLFTTEVQRTRRYLAPSLRRWMFRNVIREVAKEAGIPSVVSVSPS